MLEETIKEIVKTAVIEALNETVNTKIIKNQGENEVLTTKQLAEYLQCSIPWLTKNIVKLNIPHRRMGQVYRFKKNEISNWLSNNELNIVSKVKVRPVTIKQADMKII